MSQVELVTEQRTRQDLAKVQIVGNVGSAPNASSSSKHVWDPPETLICPPPQVIKVARFAKDQYNPSIVEKRTTDVRADQHKGDDDLNHIPDFRQDWGHKEKWKTERRAERFFMAADDIPEFPQLHGWYVVFSLHEPRYDSNTHIIFGGNGRHIHEDFFIARLGAKTFHNGWTYYVDMPEEFLSAKTKNGWDLFWTPLAQHRKSMVSSLIA